MKKAQVFFLFGSFLIVIFGFQNCSAPLPQQQGTTTGSSTATGGTGPTTSSPVNFAFDSEIDQLAYMSCNQLGASFDHSSYFGFRIGAYNAGTGIGLSSAFLKDISAQSTDAKKQSLSTQPINAGAVPIFSIRDSSNAQTMFLSSGSTSPTAGIDFSPMMTTLSDDLISNALLQNTAQRIRYHRYDGVPEGVRLEGDLNLNNGISGLNSLQLALNNGGLLAINYPVQIANPISIRAPAQYFTNVATSTLNTQVYGKGLQVSFKRNPAATYTSAPSWVLSTVNEQNMELPPGSASRTTLNKLNCPSTLIFKIADPRDLTTTAVPADSSYIYCQTKPDNPSALSSGDRELLRRARLSLRVEDWWIDWTHKCIVPKKYGSGTNQCYGDTSNSVRTSRVLVEYDLSKTCVDSPTTTAVRACAAFASICIK